MYYPAITYKRHSWKYLSVTFIKKWSNLKLTFVRFYLCKNMFVFVTGDSKMVKLDYKPVVFVSMLEIAG